MKSSFHSRVHTQETHAHLFAALILRLSRSRDYSDLFDQAFVDSIFSLAFQRVQSALRSHDDAYPIANDEIAVVLSTPGQLEDVALIAGRLIEVVQRAYVLDGKTMYLGASLGVAVASDEAGDSEILLQNASIAMREARQGEPGTIQFFDVAMEQRMWVQHTLRSALRKALPLRQMELYYQPQVDLASRDLIGFEALLRWKHPELGWISPADFIPLAEEIGLISNIGRWVLRTACQQAFMLPVSTIIAVNASSTQLKNGSLVEAVKHALSTSGLPPARLEIEITEGVLLGKSASVQGTLHALHEMGVRLALDDFGSGYSSLGQLANLQLNRIKIDRSLLSPGGNNSAIVRAVATLGVGLNLSTLAEGIETEEQCQNAYADGCTCGQGYLFGRPVPADQLNEIVVRSDVCQSSKTGSAAIQLDSLKRSGETILAR